MVSLIVFTVCDKYFLPNILAHNGHFSLQLWSILMFLLIAVSVGAKICEFKEIGRGLKSTNNGTLNIIPANVSYMRYLLTTDAKEDLYNVEYVVITIIFLEMVIRFSVYKNKRKFFNNFLNMIDVTAIMVTVGGLAVKKFSTITVTAGVVPSAVYVAHALECMSVFRVLRMFRLVYHVKELCIMAMTVRANMKNFFFIGILITLFAMVFGFLIFFAELVDNNMTSFEIAIWWAVVTMTTLGYGDVYPVTLQGRIVGGLCVMIGIIILAMPIPLIAASFSSLYHSFQMYEALNGRNKLARITPKSAPAE